MAAKDSSGQEHINSYLFEIFKLNPEYSDIYCKITDEGRHDIKMNDFINRHYPKSPLVDNLEKSLSPYINAQEIFAVAKMRYKDALEKTNLADDIENLSTEEKTHIRNAKEDLPNIAVELKKAETQFQQEYDVVRKKLNEIIMKLSSLEKGRYEKRREFVYEMLDNLNIDRSQFKDKKIDNPLRFNSYDEAYDYMERQTTIDRTKIPIKNWQEAATNYEIFEQLVIYLGLVDCLLPLGIDYGK
jgi:hypothetical protein